MHSLILRLVGVSLLSADRAAGRRFRGARQHQRNARSQIARQLDVDENVWLRLLEQNAERLRQGSALLAADYRVSVGSFRRRGNHPSVLENHGERIGAAATALLDANMAYRALTAPSSAQAFIPPWCNWRRNWRAAPGQPDCRGGWRPLPDCDGAHARACACGLGVLMGFPLDQALADEMRQLLSVQVALVVPKSDGRVTVPVSTLPATLRDQIVAQGGEVDADRFADGVLLSRSSPLPVSMAGASIAAAGRWTRWWLAYRQLQLLLAFITAGGVLLFALGSGLMAQRVITRCNPS